MKNYIALWVALVIKYSSRLYLKVHPSIDKQQLTIARRQASKLGLPPHQRKWLEESARENTALREHTSWLAGLLRQLYKRSRRKGIDVNLSMAHLLDLYRSQDAKCRLTGIEFAVEPGEAHPFQPSIDRLDSSRGYTPENIQLVCFIYNVAKNRWDAQDVVKMAQALIKQQEE